MRKLYRFCLLLLIAGASSCAYLPPFLSHVDPNESWDQEHLKANDRGCPTAIYVAPGGDLEQC